MSDQANASELSQLKTWAKEMGAAARFAVTLATPENFIEFNKREALLLWAIKQIEGKKTELPKPTHYSIQEGNDWLRWPTRIEVCHNNRFHAIKFDNGRVFDMVNGWRPEEKPEPVDYRLVPRSTLELALKFARAAVLESPTSHIQEEQELAIATLEIALATEKKELKAP
jgi:hypothetical protein